MLCIKNGDNRNFLILDAAMNDLIRPAMYDAYHDIIPIKQSGSLQAETIYDVVGPVCETGDTFAKNRKMLELDENDLVAFRSAGAYGAVMASAYNTRPPAGEVLVFDGKAHLLRPARSLDSLLAEETIPVFE